MLEHHHPLVGLGGLEQHPAEHPVIAGGAPVAARAAFAEGGEFVA